MPGEMKIEVDYRVFRERMRALADRVIPYMKTTWAELVNFALDSVKAATPPTRSGRTSIKDLWRVTKHTMRGDVEQFVIGNLYRKKEVLLFFEEGTRAHPILPRFKTVLRFFTDAGEEVFARRVYHPGTPAYRMVATAERETNLRLSHYVAETLAMVDRMLG